MAPTRALSSPARDSPVMSLPRLLATMLTVQLLVGCAYLGVGASPEASAVPSPSPEASPSPSLTEQPTQQPTDQPTPTFSPSPLPSDSPAPSLSPDLEASNRFWNAWYQSCWFGVSPIPSSLGEMVGMSDVVLRGPIVDLYERLENR